MAEITQIVKQPILNVSSAISRKEIKRGFGRPQDNVELFLLDPSGVILFQDENFKEYSLGNTEKSGLSFEINMDPILFLRGRGFTFGNYQLVLNLHRKKLFNSFNKFLKIITISPSRQEISTIIPDVADDLVENKIRLLINEIDTAVFFKDFALNFGDNIVLPIINIQISKRSGSLEILFKLLNPLPSNLNTNSQCRIIEEITDPVSLNIDMGALQEVDESEELLGPNFKIDVRLNNSVPSSFKNYNQLLNYSLTSSYESLLNNLENKEIPEIQYDYVRPISSSLEEIDIPYHFENFVHFSSAVERLKNFEYKLQLIETYERQVSDINNITGEVSDSSITLTAREDIYNKKQKLIKGFDGYEKFLYYNSGSKYTWPKRTSIKPYILYSVTSSQAINWLGDERSTFSTYGGQLQSASLYDRQNEYALINMVPDHILDNPDNNFYQSFVHMIGQHFDGIWTYIRAITDIYENDHVGGISKELIYLQLKSLGIETFDQFENSNLIEYILGENTYDNTVGNFTVGESIIYPQLNFYASPYSISNYVTASNTSLTPKGDITREIWKRLYHNAPHLLKTKGTERGIRALMSCYGIPSTILNIKEYAGAAPSIQAPLRDVKLSEVYKTFTYEKSGLALKGKTDINSFFIKTKAFSNEPLIYSSFFNSDASAEDYFQKRFKKSIEFRIKPNRLDSNQHLWTLSGSSNGAQHDQHLTLIPYVGNDISSSGDSKQYGKIRYQKGTGLFAETSNFPIFNGDFWNIFITAQPVDPSQITSATSSIEFGALQANFNKNISSYSQSLLLSGSTFFHDHTWEGTSITQINANGGIFDDDHNGARFMFFGGTGPNDSSTYNQVKNLGYSGSMQEIRAYVGEILSKPTLDKHALEPFMYSGNTVSSSYQHLFLRLPLGSNDKRDSGSFHPNIDNPYLEFGGLPAEIEDDFIIEDYSRHISSSLPNPNWEEVIENHYLPTPDTVGISTTSEKVRIDEGTIDNDLLSPFIKSETSTLDRQPPDFEDLGVFFSPTNEINEDILYTLGSFRLDDFIGSPLPSDQTSPFYKNLKDIKDIYFKKVKRRYNYWDYIKTIQGIDHTLFKLIEQFVPAKANLKTGLLIEPHYLERSKFARTLPTVNSDITMTSGSYRTFNFQIDPERAFTLDNSSVVTTNNLTKGSQFLPTVGNFVVGEYTVDTIRIVDRKEQGTNTTIDIDDYVLDEEQNISQAPIVPGTGKRISSTLLGNATKGRLSNRYYIYRRKESNNQQTDY